MSQKCDTKQVPCLEPTHIGCHDTKFSPLGYLAPGICVPLACEMRVSRSVRLQIPSCVMDNFTAKLYHMSILCTAGRPEY